MTKRDTEKYRTALRELGERVQGTADSAEEQARHPIGGEAAGSLSNAPLHLGDMGSVAFNQEIGAALLENEQYLGDEIRAALERIDAGSFGRCAGCNKAIPKARLEALPYARHCVKCAEKFQAGNPVNVNTGRPDNWQSIMPADPTRMNAAGDEDQTAIVTPANKRAIGREVGAAEGRR